MQIPFIVRLLFITVFLCSTSGAVEAQQTTQKTKKITQWLTAGDSTVLFKKQTAVISFSGNSSLTQVITVDETQTYQSIDGFGFALTQGSAMHIIKMNAAKRVALLKELFDTTGNNIGISYIRLSIGASDLNEKIFSYNDLPAGETDTALTRFDLGPDRADVIPVMKEILAINPSIKILGSPWSPPAWMKNNNDTRGGRLRPKYYAAYATYFVKYIQAMKAEGIIIDAITIQNEPLHPGNNPSLLMTAPEHTDFVKNNLGPAFKTAGINTKIIVYDHNANRPDYRFISWMILKPKNMWMVPLFIYMPEILKHYRMYTMLILIKIFTSPSKWWCSLEEMKIPLVQSSISQDRFSD